MESGLFEPPSNVFGGGLMPRSDLANDQNTKRHSSSLP
jgi:hypothetical protein